MSLNWRLQSSYSVIFRYNEEISVKNYYSMKNTNSAKYEIVFRGKNWVCKEWTSYAENTPFCFIGIYTSGRHPR